MGFLRIALGRLKKLNDTRIDLRGGIKELQEGIVKQIVTY